MNKFYLLLFLFLVSFITAKSADTVRVKEVCAPVLLEREDNELFCFRVDVSGQRILNAVHLVFDSPVDGIRAVKLYYAGSRRGGSAGKEVLAPYAYLSAYQPGKTLAANPSYSVLKAEEKSPGREVVFRPDQPLEEGVHFFWVSLRMRPRASLATQVRVRLAEITLDGSPAYLDYLSPQGVVHRMGVGVRHAGDDGAAAFRIPGLVTTNKGTLLGVYDIRYNNSADLQEHIDIGLSRSTDGGQTWEKMRVPLSFGQHGGLPSAQNGVGDPAILVDEKTNTVWIIAAWTHGIGGQRAWNSSGQGMEAEETAQLVLAKSEDDGKTWSAPMNITEQVKDPSWFFLLQGPGRGITTEDGTLVFAAQYIGADRVPCACILYSRDRGVTWHLHAPARTNTTEAQVAEIEPGVLMLNMRDNRGGSRAVSVTRDWGKTWEEHPSSRKALPEPVCMASLLHVKADENSLGKDILLFSNPNTTRGRHHITIKASLDGGMTWLPENQVLLDEAEGWGYSCLTLIDPETVGILYESSVANMTFQAVPLKDIIHQSSK